MKAIINRRTRTLNFKIREENVKNEVKRKNDKGMNNKTEKM